MQFLVAAAAALVAVTSAAPHHRERIVYDVTDFNAACVPHSALCNYSFDVVQSQNGETIPTKCSAQAQSDGLGTLPPIVNGTCAQSSRTWAVTKKADGSLRFTLQQQISPVSYTKGEHTIKKSEIVREQTGASSQEKYTGPKDFGLTYYVD